MKPILLLSAFFVLPATMANAMSEIQGKKFNTLNMAVSSYCLDATDIVNAMKAGADVTKLVNPTENAADVTNAVDTTENVKAVVQAADICYKQADELHSKLIQQIELSKIGGTPISQSEAQEVFQTEMMIRQSVYSLQMSRIEPKPLD